MQVMGTSELAPVRDYFLTAPRSDLEKWQRIKLVDDVASLRRKAVFVHAGPEGVPTDALPKDEPSARSAALTEAEAVIVYVSRDLETAPHVAQDVKDAVAQGKVVVPLLWDMEDAAGVSLPWPPKDPILSTAFADLVYINICGDKEYERGLTLLMRVLAGGKCD